MKKVGIALGGGGARGVAHLSYLKVINEMGIKPVVVSGTSSGAIAGALYCAGMVPAEIIDMLSSVLGSGKGGGRLAKIAKRSSTLVSAAARKALAQILPKQSFEELDIPLKVTATDVNTLEPKVFETGSLLDAVMCSVALPGAILPQKYDGRYYIDGGATNIIPFDIIRQQCDILIAIDVSKVRPNNNRPNMKTAEHADWAATQQSLIDLKLKYSPVEIFERPDFADIGTMQFSKIMNVYERAEELMPEFKQRLEKLM